MLLLGLYSIAKDISQTWSSKQVSLMIWSGWRLKERIGAWGFVPLAHKSRKELVVWSKMEIDGGEDGSSQLDLIRARFLATQFL